MIKRIAKQVRFEYGDFATLSWTTYWDGTKLAIVERPWRNNEIGKSCIPEGIYTCVPARYNKGGYDAVEIMNVENRTQIKQHIGNFPWNVDGCQAINTGFINMHDLQVGYGSKQAFDKLMKLVGNTGYELHIHNQQETLNV
jgi:hypothetical protein